MAARTRVGYDIVVRFRKRRLWLFRNIPTLPDAVRIARRLQQERFHEPEAVSILDAVSGVEHSVTAIDREDADGARPAGPSRRDP